MQKTFCFQTKTILRTWLTSVSELWLLFIMLLISLFLVNELLLKVGVIVGLTWWMLTLSLELLFGDILAGKLSVLVHWDKLRTIMSFFHFQSLLSSLKFNSWSNKSVRVKKRNNRHSILTMVVVELFTVVGFTFTILVLNRPFSGLLPPLIEEQLFVVIQVKGEALLSSCNNWLKSYETKSKNVKLNKVSYPCTYSINKNILC